jgi:hypothetical protein
VGLGFDNVFLPVCLTRFLATLASLSAIRVSGSLRALSKINLTDYLFLIAARCERRRSLRWRQARSRSGAIQPWISSRLFQAASDEQEIR